MQLMIEPNRLLCYDYVGVDWMHSGVFHRVDACSESVVMSFWRNSADRRYPLAICIVWLHLSVMSASAGIDPWTASALTMRQGYIGAQVDGVVNDVAEIFRSAVPIFRLPIGVLKTVFGALLPGIKMASGFPDLQAGFAAPFHVVGGVLRLPFNILKRL